MYCIGKNLSLKRGIIEMAALAHNTEFALLAVFAAA